MAKENTFANVGDELFVVVCEDRHTDPEITDTPLLLHARRLDER